LNKNYFAIENMKMNMSKENIPIIFVFNIMKNYYREYGVSFYAPIRNTISKLGYSAEVLPIITQNYRSSIEIRAKYMSENLPKVVY
jgi:hypothetical protein